MNDHLHQNASVPSTGLSIKTILPLGVFLFCLALWTYELLAENPVPDSVKQRIPVEWRFWLAKGLHVGAYAFLTVLAGWLPVPGKLFWGVIVLLVLHGVAGEIGQTFVDGRHGSTRDVLLDWAGIVIGLVVLQCGRWAFRRRATTDAR